MVTESKVLKNAPEIWSSALPRPAMLGHKYDRGDVTVLGGRVMTGAARLAARAAARAGAGLSAIAAPPSVLPVFQDAEPHLLMRALQEDYAGLTDLLADTRHTVFVVGPGLGQSLPPAQLRDFVRAALGVGRAVVLDADGLNAFVGHVGDLQVRRGQTLVLTPHEGEFHRLFPDLAGQDKVVQTRLAARATEGIVVHKGPETVITAPDGDCLRNDDAPPTLATAGTGDVLAGLIAGLLAQGMPGLLACGAAVWMHAQAARLFGPGLVATDLPDMMQQVWRDLLR